MGSRVVRPVEGEVDSADQLLGDRSAQIVEKPVERSVSLHPILIVLSILLTAAILTHFLPAGSFKRVGADVIPGTYHAIPKVNGLQAIFSSTVPSEAQRPAQAAGIVAVFNSIPAGMTKSATLFFMVLMVGGMFGVLQKTSAVDAGVDRLLHLTSGNVYLLTAGLMVMLACGSTFLGFSSAYLALIPLVLGLGKKLGLPNLFAPAVVALSDFIGYAASVSNPIALGVAQPSAGVTLFSGIPARLLVFALFLTIGIAHVMLFLRKQPRSVHVAEECRLSIRQTAVLVTLLLGGVSLVVGTGVWSWRTPEMAAAFVSLSFALAVVGGLRPSDAADGWLEGMKNMLLSCLTIGLAGAIGIILQSTQVVDGIVQGLASIISGHGPAAVASSLMGAEMAFGAVIPSVSSKAAISLPIMTPIAHLSGVSGQIAVSALLLGSGMTNMISPTNDLLLAFLASSRVGYTQWFRFILPLFLTFTAISLVALYIMVAVGA